MTTFYTYPEPTPERIEVGVRVAHGRVNGRPGQVDPRAKSPVVERIRIGESSDSWGKGLCERAREAADAEFGGVGGACEELRLHIVARWVGACKGMPSGPSAASARRAAK